MNVPNVLTMIRIVLSIAVFVCIALCNYDLCLLLFIVASLTDYIDGWWARKFHQITVFGRIMDPFADKILICGTFIFLLPIAELTNFPTNHGWAAVLRFQPWMVVVIVARELLVTSLRAVVERAGGDFSAKWIGKWKMGLQCVAVSAAFLVLTSITKHSWIHAQLDHRLPSDAWPLWAASLWLLTLWGTIIITVYSGIAYCINAIKMIARNSQLRPGDIER